MRNNACKHAVAVATKRNERSNRVKNNASGLYADIFLAPQSANTVAPTSAHTMPPSRQSEIKAQIMLNHVSGLHSHTFLAPQSDNNVATTSAQTLSPSRQSEMTTQSVLYINMLRYSIGVGSGRTGVIKSLCVCVKTGPCVQEPYRRHVCAMCDIVDLATEVQLSEPSTNHIRY